MCCQGGGGGGGGGLTHAAHANCDYRAQVLTADARRQPFAEPNHTRNWAHRHAGQLDSCALQAQASLSPNGTASAASGLARSTCTRRFASCAGIRAATRIDGCAGCALRVVNAPFAVLSRIYNQRMRLDVSKKKIGLTALHGAGAVAFRRPAAWQHLCVRPAHRGRPCWHRLPRSAGETPPNPSLMGNTK